MTADHKFSIAIMAAGKGTRLKSRRAKVLHEIGGRALVLHVIATAKTLAAPEDIYVITGHQADAVQVAAESTGVNFVLQPEQLGTGHAIQCLQKSLADKTLPEHLLVLSGDAPLITSETLIALRDFHLANHSAMTILTAVPQDPTGYGRVLRVSPNAPEVVGIVEQKSLAQYKIAHPAQLAHPEELREINSGIYAFETAKLFAQIGQLTADNSAKELYLTDIAALMVIAGERVVAISAPNVDEVLGANTIAELMHLDAALRRTTAEKLMAAGVSIYRPETCTIDSTVTVGTDTIIEPYVQLLGETHIGSECRIRSHSIIQNSVLGDSVLVRNHCVIDSAEIGNGALIGPFAHLRPESNIGEGAHIGNFVETKKVRVGKGSKANHLTYLGDAVIGSGVNIGAGTITCNYDGVHKHQTTIEDDAFVGSNSTLIAPLTIGSGAYTAAGSTITTDVAAGSLALGRAPQTTKPGWAARRKAKK